MHIFHVKKKMAVNSNTWSDLFTKKFSDYSAYVSSLDDAMRVLTKHMKSPPLRPLPLLSKQRDLEALLLQEILKVYMSNIYKCTF